MLAKKLGLGFLLRGCFLLAFTYFCTIPTLNSRDIQFSYGILVIFEDLVFQITIKGNLKTGPCWKSHCDHAMSNINKIIVPKKSFKRHSKYNSLPHKFYHVCIKSCESYPKTQRITWAKDACWDSFQNCAQIRCCPTGCGLPFRKKSEFVKKINFTKIQTFQKIWSCQNTLNLCRNLRMIFKSL